MARRALALLAASAVVLGLAPGAGATSASFVEVDPFVGGGQIRGADLNDGGVVVGSADVGGGTNHAFGRTPDGTLTDLGVLGTGTSSSAAAVNAAGVVVGTSATTAVGDVRGFVWTDGTGMVDLGLLAPGDSESSAVDLNDAGWIIGNAGTSAWVRDPADGILVEIDPLPTATIMQAVAINDAGTVVGTAFVPGGLVGFVWTETGGTVAIPAPEVGATFRPSAIDGNGRVLGTEFDLVAGYRTWIWDPADGFLELTGPNGFASVFGRGLNDRGVVVGFAEADGTSARSVAIWDSRRDSTATVLASPAPGSIDASIDVVNDSGALLATTNEVVDEDDFSRTFLGQVVVPPDPLPNLGIECDTSVVLQWNTPAFQGYEEAVFIVQRDGVTIGSVAGLGIFRDVDPPVAGAVYSVFARNSGGDSSARSVVTPSPCPRPPDTTAPPAIAAATPVAATPSFAG